MFAEQHTASSTIRVGSMILARSSRTGRGVPADHLPRLIPQAGALDASRTIGQLPAKLG